MTCRGSGRVVSKVVRKRSIHTRATGWIGRCPYCAEAAPWATAEVRKDGKGYNARYSEH